jgi:hypothetical protein
LDGPPNRAGRRHRPPDQRQRQLLLDLPRNTTFGWLPLIFIVGAEKLFLKRTRIGWPTK